MLPEAPADGMVPAAAQEPETRFQPTADSYTHSVSGKKAEWTWNTNPNRPSTTGPPTRAPVETTEVVPPDIGIGNNPTRYTCPVPNSQQMSIGCAADLARHHNMVHDTRPKATFPCDYRRCSRASPGTPFYQRDHFRDHLREFHKEDLVRRGVKASKHWWMSRYIRPDWWRCSRCYQRVNIDPYGWVCADCGSACEEQRQEERRTRKESEQALIASTRQLPPGYLTSI
ncbi:hypothetical protein V8F06_005772 [Rhypophila decipiens]